MNKPESVDEYIARATGKVKEKLEELRKLIKATVPEATEKISYGMAYYGYKGRLTYFGYFQDHIGLYIMHDLLSKHKNEVGKRRTGRATLRLEPDEKIPVKLIKKLLMETVKINKANNNCD
jgi:uncharacterized protein YdhG (YjbR/CyaY superfamily)